LSLLISKDSFSKIRSDWSPKNGIKLPRIQTPLLSTSSKKSKIILKTHTPFYKDNSSLESKEESKIARVNLNNSFEDSKRRKINIAPFSSDLILCLSIQDLQAPNVVFLPEKNIITIPIKSETEILKIKMKDAKNTRVNLKLKMYENSIYVKKFVKRLTTRVKKEIKKHFSEIEDIF